MNCQSTVTLFLRGLLLAGLILSGPLSAHELKSVVLRLDETTVGEVRAMMKTPLALGGEPVAVVPQFESGCQPEGTARVEREPGIVIRQWRMNCAGGLIGQRLRIEGLDPQTPDAVVMARFASGATQTLAIDRHDPSLELGTTGKTSVALGVMAYLPLGIEHILLGTDHLLFVLELMLVVFAARLGLRMLVLSLTAFTVAHSITLALAVLGIWGLPPKPVEIMIALSILLLAAELAEYPRRQQQGLPPSFTLRKPWAVAFTFGLLHGFGFAGALAEVGLPQQARGWALFLFNLGVEAGQLMFISAVLLCLLLARRISWRPPYLANADGLVVTLLGGIAAYWTLERIVAWTAALHLGV